MYGARQIETLEEQVQLLRNPYKYLLVWHYLVQEAPDDSRLDSLVYSAYSIGFIQKMDTR